MYISTAPHKCSTPKIRSALKKRSAISPTIKGAIIAPQLWVENAIPIWLPLADKVLAKYVPKVTNQPPQIKNCKNIMVLRRRVIMILIILCQRGSVIRLCPKCGCFSFHLPRHRRNHRTRSGLAE